ncbi:hypothetical protein SAMN02990966_02199 [Rhodospirillales bacterium URHD0017]|nr:hypothetical protein SAMN02990966_02199 [Rhodospirillales bacterium URHD0017]
MIPAAQRMVTELLARQLGIDVGELDTAVGDDPMAAFVALSIAGQPRAAAPGGDSAGERLARVAVMVGACSLCLGEEPACLECGGVGRPGSRAPDREALLRWIRPSLRRVDLCLSVLRERPENNHGRGDER